MTDTTPPPRVRLRFERSPDGGAFVQEAASDNPLGVEYWRRDQIEGLLLDAMTKLRFGAAELQERGVRDGRELHEAADRLRNVLERLTRVEGDAKE